MDFSPDNNLSQFEKEKLQKQQQLENQKALERNNLNRSFVRDDFDSLDYYGVLKDFGAAGIDGTVLVFFKELEDHLIKMIKQADVVIGCVAWLTSIGIIQALSEKKGISFIVQKEDFLRPDNTSANNWPNQLRQLYDRLPGTLDRRDFYDTILGAMACNHNPLIDPVRCVGNYNFNKESAYPRSHHKFALFCKYIENCHCKACRAEISLYMSGFPHCDYCKGKAEINHIKPYAVWTGSFNFTKNAVMSFENAVVISDPNIVNAFYREFSQIAAISESLDWTANWISPEWIMQTYT